MRGWVGRHRQAGTALVSLLIVALLPTPLPRVEFHNVRHHDAVGQVCEYHDHLLRWHPDATRADDVPILHWHWGWLGQGDDDSSHSGQTPLLHAFHAAEALTPADSPPAIVANPALNRLLAPPLSSPPSADFLFAWSVGHQPHSPRSRPTTPAGERVPPRAVALHASLLRWIC